MYVVGEVIGLPADMKSTMSPVAHHLLNWQTGEAMLNDAIKKGALAVPVVLKRLSEQTGLTFSKNPRRLRILLIERAD